MVFGAALALTTLLFAGEPARAAPVVTVRRADAPDSKIKSWFETLDRLLQKAHGQQVRLAAAAPRPAAGDGLEAARALQALAADYATLTGDSSGGKEAGDFAAAVAAELEKIPATEPMGKEMRARVFALEKPSVNRWLELLRQQALAAPGPKKTAPANALLTLTGTDETTVEAAYLEIAPSGVLSPALRALAAAAAAEIDPALSAVAAGSRVWLSKEGAALYGDFALPGSGGLIRLRLESPGGDGLSQSRFYFTTRALYELGFAVSVDNGVLTALFSGERARLDLDSRVEIFAAAWKAVETGRALAPRLRAYLAGTVNQEQNAERLDVLARIFAAEGRLPMLEFEPFPTAVAQYGLRGEERERLRAEFNKTLERLGLGSFPPFTPFGQRTLDLYYNGPIRAAVARGELVLEGGAYRENPGYRPRVPRALDPRAAAYDWSSLYAEARLVARDKNDLVFRTQWRLDAEDWLIVYFSRAADSGALSGLSASGHSFDTLAAKLAALGLLVEKTPTRVRESFGRRRTPDPAREVFGTTAAPGSSVLARVTYDRATAERGGRIFVTPYVAVGDHDAVRRSRGLLTTAGGAQAAIVAGLAGVPAVDIPAGVWGETAGLSVDLPVFAPSGRVTGFKRIVVRDGMAVRLDPGRGAASFPDPESQSWLVAMEEALTAYDRGADINALALWARGRLSTAAQAERAELGRLLVAEMEARAKTGVSPEHLQRIKRVVASSGN